MALLQAEAEKLSLTNLQKGIIETIVTKSDVLQKLPFKTLNGISNTYNREVTIHDMDFVGSYEDIPESSITYEQVTEALARLAQQDKVDLFIDQTLGNYNDQVQAVVRSLTKAMKRKFEYEFVYGNTTTGDPKGFNGLHKLCDSTMVINQGSTATGAALSLANIDRLLDKFDETPDAIIMRRGLRTRIRQAGRGDLKFPSDASKLAVDGKSWDGVPILIDDWITQTETIATSTFSAATGGATTSLFAVRFDENDGLHGLQNGTLNVEKVGRHPTKDADIYRIKWYCGLAATTIKSIARIDGITDVACVV